MRRTKRPPIQQLRSAIDCLPLDTRIAMLEGVRANDIIVGAYSDRRGGVCPMLAAHRCGGRTDFISFARAWDTFGKAGKRSRRANEREVGVLTSHLEASILEAEGASADLKAAVADHERLVGQRPDEKVRPGDPDRSHELAGRPGWSWLKPFRRWDEYEQALAQVEAAQARADEDAERADERELVS